MSDVAEFLLARIAEDEARAKAVPSSHGISGSLDSPPTVVAHYVEWSPVRVLLECQIKRKLAEFLEELINGGNPQVEALLRAMALPYQDHAGFRREWVELQGQSDAARWIPPVEGQH